MACATISWNSDYDNWLGFIYDNYMHCNWFCINFLFAYIISTQNYLTQFVIEKHYMQFARM